MKTTEISARIAIRIRFKVRLDSRANCGFPFGRSASLQLDAGRAPERSILQLQIAAGSVRRLRVERLAIADAAAKELRPIGYDGKRIRLLGQQRPQRGMMPA